MTTGEQAAEGRERMAVATAGITRTVVVGEVGVVSEGAEAVAVTTIIAVAEDEEGGEEAVEAAEEEEGVVMEITDHSTIWPVIVVGQEEEEEEDHMDITTRFRTFSLHTMTVGIRVRVRVPSRGRIVLLSCPGVAFRLSIILTVMDGQGRAWDYHIIITRKTYWGGIYITSIYHPSFLCGHTKCDNSTGILRRTADTSLHTHTSTSQTYLFKQNTTPDAPSQHLRFDIEAAASHR